MVCNTGILREKQIRFTPGLPLKLYQFRKAIEERVANVGINCGNLPLFNDLPIELLLSDWLLSCRHS